MHRPEADRWDYDLRHQPWTLVGLTGVVAVIVAGMIVVGTVLSDAEARDYGYGAWAAASLAALGFLIVVVWCEKRDLWIFSQKLPAWRLLQAFGLVLAVISGAMILWPFSPLGLRVRAS